MMKVIVVGSGAAGAAVAKELQGRCQVTVLEAGGPFRPFPYSLRSLEKLRRTGLFFDEKAIPLLFPAMRIRKTGEGMVLVNGRGLGGTTTISAGNGLRLDHDLKRLGIDLDQEFSEVSREIPLTTEHQKNWRPATRRLFEICGGLGFAPRPLPKMGEYGRCTNCGRCLLGCPQGVKWDSRSFLRAAEEKGAKIITSCHVERVAIGGSRMSGVVTRKGFRRIFMPADILVLAAGGFGTPIILKNSGIACRPSLFVDPVLCVAAAWEGALQNAEICMPFVLEAGPTIISPYFDPLSFFFNKDWRLPARNIISLMIKLADSNQGDIEDGRIRKALTSEDIRNLSRGVDLCSEILMRFGVDRAKMFFGTLNAGHPGGMLPLTAAEAESLRPPGLPENLYLADTTLFPASLGKPPILTITALAKKVAKRILRTA